MATSKETAPAKAKEAAPAKPKEVKPREAPPPRAVRPLSPALMNIYRLLKVIGMLAGFTATLLGLMACIGLITENGYARALGALFVTIAVPLVIGDRLLPKDDPARAKGLITEVMALTWVTFGFAFATLANASTGKLLVKEGDRLQRDGVGTLAAAAYFLGGVRPEIPPPAAAPDPSASSSASASATGAATVVQPIVSTATPSASASASTEASAAPSASASAGAKSDKPEKTPAALFKELAPAVVTIFAHGQAGDGSGTGFLIDKEGTIVTNHHVIGNATAVKIKMMSGASYTTVELLADSATADLALLRVDLTKPADGTVPDVVVLTLGDSDSVVVGEHAVSIGNPLGLEHTLTDGLVSARRMYEGRAWIQMSVPVSPGNSGGPLFNMHGEVIGVTTAQIGAGMFERAQNLNLAVPVNELKKLLKPEYPGKRKFGDVSTKGQW